MIDLQLVEDNVLDAAIWQALSFEGVETEMEKLSPLTAATGAAANTTGFQCSNTSSGTCSSSGCGTGSGTCGTCACSSCIGV